MSKSFRNDLTGQRFGKLTVLEFVPREGTKKSYWKCRCDCGGEKIVAGHDLKLKYTQSCGCLAKEIGKQSGRILGENNCVHGCSKTRLYYIWKGMRQRCYNHNNPDYKNYGGRGIKICDEWLDDFQAFRDWATENGYREGLSIDRIDNDRNYEPDNCRWISIKQQQRNKRNNLIVEYNGEEMCLSDVANTLGISKSTLLFRYHEGDRGERLFRPVESKN